MNEINEESWPVPEPLVSDERAALPVFVGDTVVAADGPVGRVDRILRSETAEPMFVVVEVRARLRRRYPVLPFRLLGRVDRKRDIIEVRGCSASIKSLPEALPLLV